MLVRTASIIERLHTVQCTFTNESVQPIDEPITFPHINSNKVILPHEDTLVLTLGVGCFDVHIILINLGNSTNLL